MAASNLYLGKASGGVLNIQPADGTTTTSLVLPAINGTVVAADSNGILTLSPNHTSGIQDGLILYDGGSGVSEGLKIKWSSLNYSNIAAIYGSGNYGLYFQVGGADKMLLDTSGNLLLQSGTGGLGYGNGAGGTVTQLTNKSTAVTLNKPTGIIIMNNATLAAGASVYFTLNNTLLSFSDKLIVNGTWGFVNPQSYRIECAGVWSGAGVIRVTNITAGSLSEAVEIEFSILKGVNS